MKPITPITRIPGHPPLEVSMLSEDARHKLAQALADALLELGADRFEAPVTYGTRTMRLICRVKPPAHPPSHLQNHPEIPRRRTP